jgi:hypothetical protein
VEVVAHEVEVKVITHKVKVVTHDVVAHKVKVVTHDVESEVVAPIKAAHVPHRRWALGTRRRGRVEVASALR